MNPIVLAAFPGLLFSVQPPAHRAIPRYNTPVVAKDVTTAPIDSCSTYIYTPTNTLYYNGKPVSPELLHKLGPLAAPVRYGLSLENIG